MLEAANIDPLNRSSPRCRPALAGWNCLGEPDCIVTIRPCAGPPNQ